MAMPELADPLEDVRAGLVRVGRRRIRIVAIYAALVVANAAAWSVAVAAFHGRPALLGTALLAYVLGLRHALDADHLAAIDNVTRKLMHDGQRPVTVGLHFSLGHSTIVFFACMAVVISASAFERGLPAMMHWGSAIGTAISASFLLLIAIGNMRIVGTMWRAGRKAGSGSTAIAAIAPAYSGLVARLCRPLLGVVRRSWHMYPLGVLFGLGFDTASEIALLGISAMQAAHGLSWQVILVFPVLFTAGMSLVDTSNGVVMSRAYGWAITQPSRRRLYDMTITTASIVAALLVGIVELLGLIGQGGETGTIWRVVDRINQHAGTLGGLMIAFFLGAWVVFSVHTRRRGADDRP